MAALTKKFTLNDLRAARQSGAKVPMLTCYDFSTARLMQEAGVPTLLVGDSAANVILGHETTLPVPLSFMIEITAAVRRGAPLAFVVADLPFGSFGSFTREGVKSAIKMMKRTGCDCVKIETNATQTELVKRLAGCGVPVMAHLGLRPQSVQLLGGYKFQGRTAKEADEILALALRMEHAGAAAILIEAVPPEVAKAVVDATNVPIIGCGAGPSCHSSVIVTHDAIGLSTHAPRFVPRLGDAGATLRELFASYVQRLTSGAYPAPEHQYEMPAEEKAKFLRLLQTQ